MASTSSTSAVSVAPTPLFEDPDLIDMWNSLLGTIEEAGTDVERIVDDAYETAREKERDFHITQLVEQRDKCKAKLMQVMTLSRTAILNIKNKGQTKSDAKATNHVEIQHVIDNL